MKFIRQQFSALNFIARATVAAPRKLRVTTLLQSRCETWPLAQDAGEQPPQVCCLKCTVDRCFFIIQRLFYYYLFMMLKI